MATSQEQQMAKELLIAWLNAAAAKAIVQGQLADPMKAGEIIGHLYKSIVKAISETSTSSKGGDATA